MIVVYTSLKWQSSSCREGKSWNLAVVLNNPKVIFVQTKIKRMCRIAVYSISTSLSSLAQSAHTFFCARTWSVSNLVSFLRRWRELWSKCLRLQLAKWAIFFKLPFNLRKRSDIFHTNVRFSNKGAGTLEPNVCPNLEIGFKNTISGISDAMPSIAKFTWRLEKNASVRMQWKSST